MTSAQIAPATVPVRSSKPMASLSVPVECGVVTSNTQSGGSSGGPSGWVSSPLARPSMSASEGLSTQKRHSLSEEDDVVDGGHKDWIELDDDQTATAGAGKSALLPTNEKLRDSASLHAQKQLNKQKGYQVKTDAYWQERVIATNTNFGGLYIFFIGVSAPCGAIYTTWSNILPESGTIGLWLAIVAIAAGYVVLTCCLGEMSATFPFAGGSFGFARALLGKIPAQIVGFAETMEWLLIGVGFISLVSQGFTQVFGTDPVYEGLWLVLLYALTLALNLMGGYYLYVPFAVNMFLSVTFLIIYCLGMAKYGDWNANAGTAAGQLQDDGVTPMTTWFINGFAGFLQALPYAVFTLVGFEICPLISDEVVEPKKNVPRGMISSAVVVCGMAVVTITAALSCPQLIYGNLAGTVFPLTDGFSLIFAGANAATDPVVLRFDIMLPVFTQWAAFMTCCMAWGRQMFAMARSGLMPHWLSATWKRRGTPAAALIAGTFASLGVALFVRFIGGEYTVIANQMLFNVGIMGCCINYLFQALSFIMLRIQYQGLSRPFYSPLGIGGAVYVALIYSLTLAGILQYPYIWESILMILLIIGVGLVYYFAYARKHLIMSPEEYRSLFVLYSMKFVRDKQRRATHKDDNKVTRISSVVRSTASKASLNCPSPQHLPLTTPKHASPQRPSRAVH